MKTVNTFILLSLIIGIFSNCALPPNDDETTGKGDFTSNLPWDGNTDKFTIDNEGIHLNDPQGDAGSAFLTTPSTTVTNTRWEFGVRLTFNPSANNYARFYLTSSSKTLSGTLNGYFIQIGGAKDNVGLYRQDGDQPLLIASGRELMKGNNSPKLYVKVECDNNGYWTFWTRLESEGEYVKEKQVKESSISHSAYCGIYCVYTKSRCDGFTFHHISLSNDVETNTQPEETTNLPEDVRSMLLFNEVMYDNASNGAQYVEIYNPTEEVIAVPALYLYKMHESGTVYSTTALRNGNLPIRIPSKGYLCFTKSASKVVQKHNATKSNLIEITDFPTLEDNGGYLALSSSEKIVNGHTFDTCSYSDAMHDTDKKKRQGISLEKKSPDLSSLKVNWHSSEDATGGSPGRKNAK